MPIHRLILIAAVLAGQFVSGWMRQCCAAGCVESRPNDSAPAHGCCERCAEPAEPVRCCVFGKHCRDEAEREKKNPTPAGESRTAAPDMPVALIGSTAPAIEPAGGSIASAIQNWSSPTSHSRIELTSRRRN